MRERVGAGGVVAALSVAGDLTRGHRVPDDVDWSAEADSRAAPWYGPRAGQTGVADFFRDMAGSIEITEFTPAPFLTPSLFRVRGFVAGLVMGFVFFAAVAGLLYATSLYLQFGRGLAPLPTAGLMAPLSAGIIAASFSACGRRTARATAGGTRAQRDGRGHRGLPGRDPARARRDELPPPRRDGQRRSGLMRRRRRHPGR